MPFYENVLIARQDVSSAQVDSITDSMTALIDESGGRISRREYWGVRSLEYRIKKNKKGHYVLLNFEAPADTVQEMERQLRLNEDILRFMTIRTEDLPEQPSVFMSNRGERGRYRDRADRPDRGDRGGNDDSSDSGEDKQ